MRAECTICTEDTEADTSFPSTVCLHDIRNYNLAQIVAGCTITVITGIALYIVEYTM